MNLNDNIVKEWNDLGFYYIYNEILNQWWVLGSKVGLQKIIEIISLYANSPAHGTVSDHIHIGPYNYLKIMTWHEPIIKREYIAGTLSDLLTLEKIIASKLARAKVGEVIKITDEYSLKSTASLMLIIMGDEFRPSSIEFDN